MYKVTLNTIWIISLLLIILLAGCKKDMSTKMEGYERVNSTIQEEKDVKSESNEKANEEIMKVVESMQKIIPFKAGDIQWEKVEFVPDKDLYIYMTNLNESGARIEDNTIMSMGAAYRKDVKRDKKWAIFRKHSVNIHFKFQDKGKNELYEFLVTPEDYK